MYYPQTDRLVERINKTLKSMLHKKTDKDGRVCEVPQSTKGFSPFELLYGRLPHGLLDIEKEIWEKEALPPQECEWTCLLNA